MKKIGIITILKVNNYGAELQAFATQRILEKLGYRAEIIDYLFYKNPEHIASSNSNPLFKMSLKKRLSEFLFPVITRFKGKNGNKNKLRQSRFTEFIGNNVKLSETYESIEKLYSAQMDYDIYLSGSDQIWNPGIYSSLMPYFLDFAPAGRPKIAFGSSFGVSSLPENTKAVYHKSLSQYKRIGVRESSAVDMLKEIGISATSVLDPTLILDKDEWIKVSKPLVGIPMKYLLIYEITPSPEVGRIAHIIAKEKGLEIVRICNTISFEDKHAINIIDAGPAEFLYLFDKASFIVTNSFHGTAFSLNFGKEFYVVTPKRKNNNTRQQSLLKLMGLSNRILPDISKLDKIEKIDYSAVYKRLNYERKKSTVFLISAIEDD